MTCESFTLYYFPMSFYSQKALLAFYEKDVTFKKYTIDIQHGYQLEPWYMKINPNATVPTLQHGDKLITDSEDIVRYLDKIVPTGPTLCPDPSSPVGKEVEKWCKKLNSINIGDITFGVLRNPELSASGIKIPAIIRRIMNPAGIKRRLKESNERIRKYADQYPDLKQAYLAKLKKREQMQGESQKVKTIADILDDLDLILDEIEEQLKKTREVQGSQNCWLIGPEFTGADIFMAIFLDRLDLVGLQERYFSKNKRPLIFDYYQRIGNRKSVQKLRVQAKSDGVKVILGSLVKNAMPGIVGVASVVLAAGLGFYFFNRNTI